MAMARRLAVLAATLVLAVGALSPAAAAADPLDDAVAHDLSFAASQLNRTLSEVPSTAWPYETGSDGRWTTKSAGWWTSGFFPGSLWMMYRATGDAAWRTAAEARQAGLESQNTRTDTHDLGFMLFDSFGNGYRLTGTDSFRQVALTAAGSLATRYSPIVHATRSWNNTSSDSPTDFKVIVDNMMNLELMFWASKHGGDPSLATKALDHALTTAREHVRPDGSTYHLVVFDSDTGGVKRKQTVQGYSDSSTWSRGQAWGLYGFTMAYRETRDSRMLATARLVADYFVSHLPADGVPYWDFQAPGIPNEPRDTSAAAIAASGLLELSQLDTDATRRQHYLTTAKQILTSLSSPAYLAEGTTSRSILLHGTANKPGGEYDHGLIYGDYFFLEALLRYRDIARRSAQPLTDFNGDGYGDLAVGAPGESSGTTDGAGCVNVLYGTSTGLTSTGARALSQGSAAGSVEAGDHFGASVATGDFNRDGYSDLAVGAPEEDSGPSADAGFVNVLYGGPGGLTGTAAQQFSQSRAGGTAETGDRFGAALSSGDFNGDGYADLAIGAPGETGGSAAGTGAVSVLLGGSSGLSTTGARTFDQGFAGGSAEPGDHFGAALASGNLDGDGYWDLAIGAPDEDSGSTGDAGVVNVLYGASGGVSPARARQFGQGSAAGAAEPGDRFGAALAVGNFDGLGQRDLAIGAPGEDSGTTADAGFVNVLYSASAGLGSARAQQFSQGGAAGSTESGDHFGAALAAGNADGDAYADLSIGTPDEDSGPSVDAGFLNALYGAGGGLSSSRARQFGQGGAGGSTESGDRFGAAAR
jgi:unsaturated chondroitin disaccharide hydrolase